MIAEIVA
jgi:hypothetical protein